MSPSIDDPESVRSSAAGGLGEIVLDRPGALNALDLPMVRTIDSVLRAWADDDDVHAVLIRSDSSRAFCAGGDVRAVRQARLDGDDVAAEQFFVEEYAMNLLIAEYAKPIIAIADGICMGGGIGIAGHSRHCVVTERSILAMPETAIGFFPDVGGTWLLPRLPGACGRYLGLTGARIDHWDAVWCGLASHFVPSEVLERLVEAIRSQPHAAADLLAKSAQWPDGAAARPATEDPVWASASVLAAHREAVDRMFEPDDLGAILQAVAGEPGDFARSTRAALVAASPSAMRVTLELLADPLPTLRESLVRETEVARRMTREHDFLEGVRAVLVDKDGHASWSPATVEQLATR